MQQHFSIEVSSAPAVEPLSLAEIKGHLRIDADETAEDTELSAFIKTARLHVERIYGQRLINQTIKIYLDDFPACAWLRLPIGPVQSISSITYQDVNDATQTWDSGNYQLDAKSNPARLALEPDADWPDIRIGELNAVTITLACGHGAAGSDVPEAIRSAMKLMVGHWYEHREDTQTFSLENIPMGAKALLADYRTEWFS